MAEGDRLIALTSGRVIVPAAGALWGAGAAMYAVHVNPAEAGLGAGLVTAVAYGTRARPLTTAAAVTGMWLTLAARYGPLAAPHAYWPLTAAWGAAALGAVVAAMRHPAVREAKRKRAARRALIADAHALGIRGAHLLSCEETRLGEQWVLDTTGTGRLASQVAHSGLAERIAQNRGLPRARVRVTEHRLAGRVVVSIRDLDPWEHPIPHPLFDGEPELDLPVPCTITQPFPVGQDPETGDTLTVTLWDEVGAKVVMVVGKRGAGKDVLLNNTRERVTAAEDADLWQINVSKAQEERAWEQAAEYSACGPEAYKRACRILLAACRLVDERGAARRGKTTFRPTAENRLKVLVINEIDALLQHGDPSWVKAKLRYLTSKARSEGVALVISGQRAVAHWIGGTDVRANIDYVAVGKVHDPGEVNHAVGRLIGAVLPDMSTYGEGHPGVWAIVDDGGNYQVGRTFELPANEDLEILRELARERSQRVPVLVGAQNLPASNLPAGNPPSGDSPHGPPPPPGDSNAGPEPNPDDPLAHWDADLMRDLPQDLRDELDKIAGRNAATKRILDETPGADSLPEVDQDQLARSAQERWAQAAHQAALPDDQRQALIDLLDGDGTTIKKAAAALGQTPWTVRCWLEKLRNEHIAETTGKGRGTRWVRTKTTNSDDA